MIQLRVVKGQKVDLVLLVYLRRKGRDCTVKHKRLSEVSMYCRTSLVNEIKSYCNC